MRSRNTRNILIALGLLLEFSFTVMIAALGGYYIDRWKETVPRYTILLMFVALVINARILWIIYKRAKETLKDENGHAGKDN